MQDKSFTDNLVSLTKDEKLAKKALAFAQDNEKSIIEFIDKDLAKNGGKLANITLQAAEKTGLVNIVKGARNPLKYIETKELTALNLKIKDLVEVIGKKANPEDFIKKIKMVKRASIITNIAICSAAMAYGLPKLQYWFRAKVSSNTIAPGLTQYYDDDCKEKSVKA